LFASFIVDRRAVVESLKRSGWRTGYGMRLTREELEELNQHQVEMLRKMTRERGDRLDKNLARLTDKVKRMKVKAAVLKKNRMDN
jgi:hypothetical protein